MDMYCKLKSKKKVQNRFEEESAFQEWPNSRGGQPYDNLKNDKLDCSVEEQAKYIGTVR